MTASVGSTADLSAIDLMAAYRSGDLSPVRATEDALERIEKFDGQINAFVLVDREAALASARESEERWQNGTANGLLDGVPMSIKDVLLTEGWPTLRGSYTIDEAGPWTMDSPAVDRVREQGAVLLGKTTTPEYAWKGVTDSRRYGATGNPWNPAMTCGGSSGGSAAAVGLGMGALSLGTDGGGSVRIPAAFTGTTTIKPTYGRVPHSPASPFGTLAHVGPMTRNATDAALLLDVVAGFDARDPWALAASAHSSMSMLGLGVAGLRIAASPTLGYASLHPEVAAAFEVATRAFVDLGARVEQADPGFADPVGDFQVLWFSGAAKVVEHLDTSEIDPGLAEVAEAGARYTALEYLGAMSARNDLGALMGAFHTQYDLLLTPCLPIPAFEVGREVPPGWHDPRWTSWTPFTYPFNMTQQPAASIPCGFTEDGLPIGLQIIGARHDDGRVLAAAHAFQQVTNWHLRRPPLIA